MHMNAVWQSFYVCATQNFCTLLTSTEKVCSPDGQEEFEGTNEYVRFTRYGG